MGNDSLTRRGFIKAAAAAVILIAYAAKTAGASGTEGKLEAVVATESGKITESSLSEEEDLLDTYMLFERPLYGPR